MSDPQYGQERANELQAMTRNRDKLSSFLKDAATTRLSEMGELALNGPPIYLVSTGFDFSEFGAVFADSLGSRLCGVACFWTEICDLPYEERVFAVPQHYIEPIDALNFAKQRALLYTQSIIADKAEILTILSRIVEKVNPVALTIASTVINADVKIEIEVFLRKYFNGANLRFVGENVDHDLRTLRSDTARSLDDRAVKLIPLMSPWILERRFGPDPNPAPRSKSGLGTRGLGG
ncbi:hypothetical protein D9M68_152020 [compost metagenome]